MNAFVCKLCVLLLLLLGGPSVFAQQQLPQQGPLMGSEASPEVPNNTTAEGSGFGGEDGVFRILVVGDGLAGGLGAGMSRLLQEDTRYEILNRFNESSGLARVEVYDWPNAISKIVADKPVDALVVLVGVNDRQEVRNGNIRYVFKSPDWITGYTAHVDRMLDAAKAANARVYWISIPPMADPAFDADMRFLSDIHRQRVAAKGGQYIDVRPFFLAPDGSYVDRGPDETGVERKLRSRDGVTFFKQGNNRFGQLVLEAINPANAKDPGTNVATDLVIPPNSTANALPEQPTIAGVTEAPIFGQDGLDGEQITFRADTVLPGGVTQVSDAQRNVPLAAAITKHIAKSGTQAERFLRDGIADVAPTGRFDDYSEPPATAAQ